MSNTQINGAKINIEMLNQYLAIKLKEALNSLQQNKVIGKNLDKEQEKQNELQQDEKCFKCRRHCRTRSVMCKNNHWVHYKCDKLDEKEIEVIEQSEHNYVCKTCTNEEFDSRNNFEQLAILDNNCAINNSELSIADMMLQEEIQCYACNKPSRIHIFNEDLVGAAILELSKFVMNEFHYKVMLPRYKEHLNLIITDTDSLVYEIFTEHLYDDMGEFQQYFDTPNYEESSPLYNTINKRVPGK
ncbi:unnamed protein product [Mytilus edulis]|uniref:Uncharacterized protein n=1 Tax=Mytilus edulis TaxID=6550 RepID=A0A8S3R9N9_MYTED|nr:unnamed protein product [Mytilus edulis]